MILSIGRFRDPEDSFAPLSVVTIPDRDRATVGLGDLSAQKKAYSGAVRFGGVEGNEEIGRVR